MALTPFKSKIITDTGISMGDEGKGRLVYELIEELKQQTGSKSPVSIVLKVNGGANSGHTAGGLKLNLLPAGVIESSVKHLAIGSGVVADPRKAWWEIKPLEANGYQILNRLIFDERTMLSDVTHRLLDLAWENYRIEKLGEDPRGSTGRGISPAFADESSQWQLFFNDFRKEKAFFELRFRQRISRSLKIIQHVCETSPQAWDGFFDALTHNETRANQGSIDEGIFSAEEFNFNRFKGAQPFTLNEQLLIDTYWNAGTALLPNIGDVRELALKALSEDQYIIGEFGQSFWLDKRHGFAPNVTASHTFTPEIFQSAGIPVQPVHNVGCAKAYDTKVGTHLFISAMPQEHPLCKKLSKIEFGVSTGRQRQVGWFDAVEKGDALRYGGFEDLVINKLDALSYSDDWTGGELLICVAYQAPSGERYYHVPRDDAFRSTLKPVYQQLPGWGEDLSSIRQFDKLPANAKYYVACLFKSVVDIASFGNRTCKIPNLRYIGVGPNPDQIIKDIPEAKALLAMAQMELA